MDHDRDNSNKGLFLTDFDGTLLRSDGTFSQCDLEALEDLGRHGIKTAVATGRSLYSFLNSPGIDLPVDYIIFTMGAGVVTQSGHRLIYQLNLSSDDVSKTLNYLNGSELDFMLHHPVPENHRYFYRRFSPDNDDFETRIGRYGEFGQPLNSTPDGGYGEAAQFLAVVPQNRTADTLHEVRRELPGLSIVRSTSPLDHQSGWIEFFNPGVSKSRTAAWLAATLGVSQANTMAIGNDYNDLDMLEWAGQSFVVANAPDDMKSGFRQVASNNEGGVARAIKCVLNK